MSTLARRFRRLSGARFVLIPALAAAFGGCSSDEPPAPVAGRGNLVVLTPLVALERDAVSVWLTDAGLDTSAVRHGVDAYRLEYETVDLEGRPIQASALLALPLGPSPAALPRAVWMHGTSVYRGEAASVNPESGDRAAAFFFAAAGYATTAPDYLGLGLGEGPHPYDHIPSEVTAGLDALVASERAVSELGRTLESSVAISGHSQGGPASVALAHAIQDGAAEGLVLDALSPISGPYDMSGSLAVASRGGIAFVTAYLGYLTVAWNRWLGLYAQPSDAFLPPYDGTVEGLFDNDHTAEEVFAGLPETLEELFTPTFLAQLREPTGPLKRALEEADRVCSWHPNANVRVYASSADADVPIANARHCVDSFAASGAAVSLIDLGDADHSASMARSLPFVIEQWATTEAAQK
jgi:acetyl esterase/lipase